LDKDVLMRGRKSQVQVELTVEQRAELEQVMRSRTVSAGMQKRCEAVLAIADGLAFTQAQRQVGMSDKHLRKWCRRFVVEGMKGLQELPGRGRKPGFSPRRRGANRQAGLRAA
jgi:putative transposase